MNGRKLVTSGERLYAYLFQSSIDAAFLDRFENRHLRFTGNPSKYRLYIQEALSVNLSKRLLYHAETVQRSLDYETPAFLKEIGKFIEVLDLEGLNREGKLSRMVRDALKQRNRTIGNGLRRTMLQRSERDNSPCYLCGRSLNHHLTKKERDEDITLDHVWPRSLGGDSDEANLLPACRKCNQKKKKDFPTWAALNVHFIMTSIHPSEEEFKSLDGAERFAIHNFAAVTRASEDKCSLKRAYLSIGPWQSSVESIESEAVGDFFNLKNHRNQ